ncbi:MAG: S8 family serine peptidase [Pirellulales bacterium]
MEQRSLLSAAPIEIDNARLFTSVLDDQSAAVPAQIAGKVDSHYWELAEHLSSASRRGTRGGEDLREALIALDLPNASVAGVNALAEIRTVITTTDTSPGTITALQRAGARLDGWQFQSAGFGIQSNQLHAWVPSHGVNRLAALPVVESLSLPVNGVTDIGNETTEGDALLLADDVRSVLGFDGTGIKVGVISSGVPNRASVQTTADLPASVTIDPVRSGAEEHDEGTAMLEIVHDIAPGAELFFSGFRHIGYDLQGNEITEYVAQDMVDSINWLLDQDVDVIVDDLQFFNEEAFSDGIVAQAASNAIAEGVTFVTAAGNRANRHYQGQFSNDGAGIHDFKVGAQLDNILNVNVAAGGQVEAWLHWSDPLGTSANDYNIWFIDLTTHATLGTRGIVVQDGVGGNDNPRERAFWTNTSASAVQVGIVVERAAGVDRELEIYVTPAGTMADDDATVTDSMFGHKAVTGVITAGAIDAADAGTDTIREFSSRGPATVYTNFATQQSVARQSLDGAGINGVRTRIGELGFFDFPFFGTSAAAPHIAGIAALLLDINASSTPTQVSSFLTNNAVDIDSAGYDVNSGFGRFNALAAAYNAFTPALPDLVASSDWGISATDNNTGDTTPTFTGTAPAGSHVWLYVNNVAVAETQLAAGVTTYNNLTPTTPLTPTGTWNITVRVAENGAVPEANRSQPSSTLVISNTESQSLGSSFTAKLSDTLSVSGSNSGSSTLTISWDTSAGHPPRLLTKSGTGTVTIGAGHISDRSVSVTYINQNGTTNFDTDTGVAATQAGQTRVANWSVNASLGTGATSSNVVFNTTQNLAAIGVVGTGALVNMPANGGRVLVVDSVTVINGGKLDLYDNDLILRANSANEVTRYNDLYALIVSGYNSGAWTGAGVMSTSAAAAGGSTALALVRNSQLPEVGATSFTTFSGQLVSQYDVLVKYTYTGDPNITGLVDDDDVTILGVTYGNNSGMHWWLGDSDYDGDVDDNDITFLGANYDPNGTPL